MHCRCKCSNHSSLPAAAPTAALTAPARAPPVPPPPPPAAAPAPAASPRQAGQRGGGRPSSLSAYDRTPAGAAAGWGATRHPAGVEGSASSQAQQLSRRGTAATCMGCTTMHSPLPHSPPHRRRPAPPARCWAPAPHRPPTRTSHAGRGRGPRTRPPAGMGGGRCGGKLHCSAGHTGWAAAQQWQGADAAQPAAASSPRACVSSTSEGWTPVSSCSSRAAATSSGSFSSTNPPGSAHLPAPGSCLRCGAGGKRFQQQHAELLQGTSQQGGLQELAGQQGALSHSP